MNKLTNLTEYLTYDDVLLLPQYVDFSRQDISLETRLTSNISLKLPFVSAPMDTVTESALAIELGKLGGISIIHRNLTIEQQMSEVKKVREMNLLVGAAVGTSSGYEERVKKLVESGVSIILIDSAHGHAKPIIETLQFVKKNYPTLPVIAGNVATFDGAQALINAGADALRVGMGPGAICTTRIVSGMGVPQLTAVSETVRAAKQYNIPVIADGGIKYSGDMVKAFAAGASTVMLGNLFAQTEEAPGEKVTLSKEQIPAKFASLIKLGINEYRFKMYRGMGSEGAMKQGAHVKSEDEYHGKSYGDRVLVAEGVEGLVPVKGSVKDVVDQWIGGIKSGMYYVGCKTIAELQEKAQFIKITQSSLTESHPHSLLITNSGKSYS